MSQNVTPEGDTAEVAGQPSAQQAAVLRLAAGETVTATAKAVGVARETVHRWLRDDAVFGAALNAAKGEMLDAAERKLMAVLRHATENLMNAVEGAT